MARPDDLPKYRTIGPRVRWWRKARGLTLKQLGDLVGQVPGTISDLEKDRSTTSEKLDLIASALRVSPHYLRTDEWVDSITAADPSWPFAAVTRERWAALDPEERSHLERSLSDALRDIEAHRRVTRKKG